STTTTTPSTTTTTPSDTGKKRNTVTSKYKDCSGQNEPTLWCKNNSVVSKVQGCLGIKADGAFGPQTKGALEAKGLDGTKITQATVDKVCGSPAPKVEPSPFEDDEDDLTASSSGSAPKTDDADELS
ncbi:hypothetical protein EBU94_07675, partial [bacterium]|nr:hypothetical protein [bacterium]